MKFSLTIGLALFSLAGATRTAHAVLVTTVTEVGSDVVFSGTGTLNVSDLAIESFSSTNGVPSVNAAGGSFTVDPDLINTPTDLYSGTFVTPGPFGSGSLSFGSSGSGDVFGIGNTRIVVPDGYVSGSSLTGSSTYSGDSFASLGLTPGSYTWTWGSGANADSLTLNISAVPEPSSFVFFSLIGLGVTWSRARRR